MCFGKGDLRGNAPVGLNGDEKPPRILSSSGEEGKEERVSAPPKASKKTTAQDWELEKGYELSLAAKARKREEKLKEESPDYDPVHGRSVRETGMVQGSLGGPLGGGAGMALSGGM